MANDKLRYRIHILEAATAQELSQAKGAKDWDIQPFKAPNIHNLSLGGRDTIMTNTNRKVNSDQDNDERDSECAQAAEAKVPTCVGGRALSVAGDNWVVEYREGVGNHVMATRDIQPNEVNNEQKRGESDA